MAIFTSMNWGQVLDIQMIHRRAVDRKPDRFKVFIHFGEQNPDMGAVFQHLDNGGEIKVNHDHGFWKARRSQWTMRPQTPPVEAPKFELLPAPPSDTQQTVPPPTHWSDSWSPNK